jgi:hypothetical protein
VRCGAVRCSFSLYFERKSVNSVQKDATGPKSNAITFTQAFIITLFINVLNLIGYEVGL